MQRDNHSNRNFRHWTVVALVVSTLILVPLLTNAQEATPEGANAEQEAAPEPTRTPIPPTSEPTPTPISPTPTPEPTPTPVSPTQVSEPTPTPEQTPASGPSTPAPESSPDTEPTATPTSTPDDEPANTLECDTEAQTEIEPGGRAELHCTYTALTDGNGATVTAAFEEDPGDGWTISINDGVPNKSSAWNADMAVSQGQSIDFVVTVAAPFDATPGQNAIISVTADHAIVSSEFWGVVVSMNTESARSPMRASVENDNAGCGDEITIQPPLTNPFAAFSCPAVSGSGTISLTSISQGWEYIVNGDPHSPNTVWYSTPGVILYEFGPTGQQGFHVYLRPMAGQYSTYIGKLTLTISSVFGETIDIYDWDLIAYNGASPNEPCNPTVSATDLLFPTSVWEGAWYSSTSNTMELTINQSDDAGCTTIPGGWTIQVATDGLYEGSEGDGYRIGPENISFNGIAPLNGASGLSAGAAGNLEESKTVATAGSGVQDGDKWNASFTLQPPATAPPGHYSGTITITVASAGS